VTLLGIDLGERRIGLAIADDEGSRARALTTIRRGATPTADIATLSRIVVEHAVAEIVVGLPLDASGVDGTQAARTRAWVEAVIPALERDVSYRDERFSSQVAEERLGRMPRGRSGGPPTSHQREAYRARVDREAATIILQAELDARAELARRATVAGGTEPGSAT
jgi:putative holliday junction resolvase